MKKMIPNKTSGNLSHAGAVILNIDQIAAIRKVPYFRDTQYVALDPTKTIDYFNRMFIEPVRAHLNFGARTSIADAGAGFGWLSVACALHTPAQVIAVEMNEDRLEAAREIASIIGVADRIDWRVGKVGQLPLADRSVDLVYCVEVLEHVYGDVGAIEDLGRVSRNLVLLTTPNKWFPMIAHDTRLPFCHWLPIAARQPYAAMFNRTKNENDNIFWSPRQIHRALRDFNRVSGFLQFRDYRELDRKLPYYLPYGRGSMVQRMAHGKRLLFKSISGLGRYGWYAMPNLAAVFKRVRPD